MLFPLPFSLDNLPSPSYLVGGAVRDALLNRHKKYLDLDLILPVLAVETARKIANQYKAGFVVLDSDRHIARVVFEQLTVDFAQQEGDSLETDLGRRDFTVNAIAYSLNQEKLIDPLEGVKDLQSRLIRMVSPANLEDDPLRLLRAYRIGGQLNFVIEPKTRVTLRNLAPLVTTVAAERVRTEINYLLSAAYGNLWLKAAWEDGLLQQCFNYLTPEKIQQLDKIDEAAKSLGQIWADLGNQDPSWYWLAKLATLVSANPMEAEAELIGLKYSGSEVKSVSKILKIYSQLRELTSPISLKDQYFLFLEAKELFPIIAVFAIASGIESDMVNPMIDRYLNPQDPVAHPVGIISGNDLILDLNLKPGPQIGSLLTQIQIAHLEGKITSREEALKLAEILSKPI